ncbi:MAG: 30S ribosomal protein S6 [Bacilli bacterium]|jgi:small subunit ribosomal protein S6|nr:30S ribosomal protein S6 [Bacilli bacterium]
MNKYEIMFIVKATEESANIKKTAESTKTILTNEKANVIDFKELGEKKLAYPIKKEINGYYYVMQVEASKEAITEFDRKIKLDENILRHLIIRLDEE